MASPSSTSCAGGLGGGSTNRSACSSPKGRGSWPGAGSRRVGGGGGGSNPPRGGPRPAGGGGGPPPAGGARARRGGGETPAPRQHGLPRFAVAELPEDTTALLAARQEMVSLISQHGSLAAPELAVLREAARRRFGGEATPIPA